MGGGHDGWNARNVRENVFRDMAIAFGVFVVLVAMLIGFYIWLIGL